MNRLLVLVALLFALASVGTATASYAHGSSDVAPPVFEQNLDAAACTAVDAQSRIALYKPCAKKRGAGLACPHLPHVMPTGLACVEPAVCPVRLLLLSPDGDPDGRPGDPQFRPPRA